MAQLVLFNSLTRAREDFAPIDPANVRVYTCGPTVYNHQHIGNMRAFLFADTLGRVLRWKGWPVTHVVNITDVGHLTSDADAGDDKMERAARAQGRSIWDIAAHYTRAFKRDVARLNIVEPSRWSVATDHIAEMIAFAERIDANGYAYRLAGGLYFDVTRVPDYGRLARAQTEAAETWITEGRIDQVEGKRHAADFALWRVSAPGENRQMEWDSPWGRGAPGWHLECSVMSHRYLGARFDIHTGGIDHREIHHPNEIAQNQAHCDCADPGARLWMHNNFLVERGGKMSKSTGQFTTLRTLVHRGVHPLAYRLLCLSAHYRSELEFSGEALGAALIRLKRLVLAVAKLRMAGTEGVAAPTYRDALDETLSDDLNTPRALVVLDELLADKRVTPADRLATLREFDATLGLDLLTLAREDLRITPVDAVLTPDAIEARLRDRTSARAAKDFAASDAIRDSLLVDGVEVMDGDPLRWDWRVTP